MTDDSSDQVRNGYYYEPLKTGGPFETHLQQAGEIVGQSIVQAAAFEETGGAMNEFPSASQLLQDVGGNAGGMVGKAAGFYMDNASTIIKNINTMFNELNDPRSWMPPNLGDQP